MDIDLELPSNEQERLDIIVSTDVDLDQMHSEEEDANSPMTDRNSEEIVVPNAKTSSGLHQMNTHNVHADINMRPTSEPKNGLEFESKEEAYSFYREYAQSFGFGITIKASRRSKKSGKFIDIKIACSRFGSRRESTATVNPRPCIKTGCKASMHIKKREDGKWFVHSFIKEHNHEICPDDFYYAIRGRNKELGVVASEKKGLQMALVEGDVQLMLDHFMHMQEINPYFFHAIDINSEKKLRTVLWVDAKGRLDYKNFCDVIFFDTYYTTNEYKIPFVPIIGVNHHFQYTLFGGALIGDKATSTFSWLMKTWLKAVGGPPPRVVVTDQENILKEAVADVFPDALHCFSLWHILRRVPEKIGNIINYDNFMENLSECLYRCWTDEEFEKRWSEMLDKFELREDDWLHLLFDDRKKWVPTYMKNYFLAGMSTIERSGSVTSFFDKYICKETTFKEFIEHSEVFSRDMRDLEANADFETCYQKPELKSRSPLEKQMTTIYTSTIFKKFQLEIMGAASCLVHKHTQDEAIVTYRVDDLEERQDYLVAWNEKELDICCLCHSFEYKGILCRHAILVLQNSGVTSIPHKYILKRWSRSAKVRPSEASDRFHYRIQRFNNLCKQAIKLGEEGSLSQETYDITSQALEEVLKHCVSVNNSVKSTAEPNTLVTLDVVDMEEDACGKNMAKSSKKKKTSRKGKEKINTRAHRLKNRCVAQQVSQGMEVDSRAPTVESNCNAQQNMQGAGSLNLNATSPSSKEHDGHHNHQDMQDLEQSPSVPTQVDQSPDQQNTQGSLNLNATCPSSEGPDGHHNHQDMQDLEQSPSVPAQVGQSLDQQNTQGSLNLNATCPSREVPDGHHNHQDMQDLEQSPSVPAQVGQTLDQQNMQDSLNLNATCPSSEGPDGHHNHQDIQDLEQSPLVPAQVGQSPVQQSTQGSLNLNATCPSREGPDGHHSHQDMQDLEQSPLVYAQVGQSPVQQNTQGSSNLNATCPSCEGLDSHHNHQDMQDLEQSPSVPAQVGQSSDQQNTQSPEQINFQEPGKQGHLDIDDNVQDMEHSDALSKRIPTQIDNTSGHVQDGIPSE